MAAKQQTIQLPISQFKGLSLRPSTLNRDFNSAQLCSNLEKLVNGQGTIRKATRCTFCNPLASFPHNILFPFTYTYHDTTTGSTVEELLVLQFAMDGSYNALAPRLYRVVEQTLNIAYVGAGAGQIVFTPIEGATNSWEVQARSNNVVTTAGFSLKAANNRQDTGFNLFVTTIHADANFNCTPTSVSVRSFVDVIAKQFIDIPNASSVDLTYYDLEEIDIGGAAPKVFTDADFILPSALNYSNNIYFAYGTYEYKYDGHRFYRSGLPQATINAIADNAGGTTHTSGNTYIYKLIYFRKDNRLNEIEGEDSDDTLTVATHTMAATRDIDLTINNMIPATYPNFNIHTAKVNGAQVGVTTITVDAAHTIVVGDTAYFFDGVSSAYVEREVTAIAATTITIAGANVNVADNIFISNNVRIQIWRTKNNGTDFYFVDEIPNDSLNATQVYLDDVPDSSLIEPFVEQLRKHTLPPKCSFIGTHQGLKVTAGDPDFPNRISWALPVDIEGVPLESNNFDVKGAGLGALTGFGSDDQDNLVVFKYNGHGHLKGILDDLNIVYKDASTSGIGCTSFRSLAYIGEVEALCGVSLKGVFVFNNGVPNLAIGDSIRPLFDQPQTKQINNVPIPDADWFTTLFSINDFDQERVLKRAVAINDNVNSKYHLYLPAEIGEPGETKIPLFTSSKYLVFDYDAEVPFWTDYTFYNRHRTLVPAQLGRQVSPNGGFTLYKDIVWFGMGGEQINGSNAIQGLLFNYKNEGDNFDYIEAAYPVYLDLQYTPFTREINSVTAFFKMLYVNLYKFLDDRLADTQSGLGLGSNFIFRLKCIKDYKNYPTPSYITNALRTFRVQSGQTSVPIKCVTDKCRAFQVQLTNEDIELPVASSLTFAMEQIKFDQIELVYSIPYDKQQKDPKGRNE